MVAMSSTPSPSANALRPNSYACCKEGSPTPRMESCSAAVYWSSSLAMVSGMVNLFQIARNEHESVVRALAIFGKDSVGHQLRRIACGQSLSKAAADTVGDENQCVTLHHRHEGCAQRWELAADHAAAQEQILVSRAWRAFRTKDQPLHVSDPH